MVSSVLVYIEKFFVKHFFNLTDLDIGNNTPLTTVQSMEFSKPADLNRPATGWINTVPLSTSTATLSKRSTKSKGAPLADNFVKCYIKKRNLILELLVSSFC